MLIVVGISASLHLRTWINLKFVPGARGKSLPQMEEELLAPKAHNV
jgi:hypothetical protein